MRIRALAFLCLSAVAQDIPRSEHPNPQFRREPWVSLNGTWEFEFDDAGKGLGENWAQPGRAFSKKILVPYAPESKLSGIGDTSFHPVVWYRRAFTPPPQWAGRRVLLRFGAVDYRATVWVNGRFAGEHEGGHVPFKFDVTPLLKPGENIVVVRAWDPPTDRAIPRGKQYWEPQSRGIFYTRTTGIWQPVWLEATGESYIDYVRIGSGLEGNFTFDARLEGALDGVTLGFTVSSEGKVVAWGEAPAQGKYATPGGFIRSPQLWSVERPRLYDVTLELRRNGQTVDRVESYFGFRKVAIENGRVTLNGRPIYLKFLLDQGYWPESLLTPPTDAAIQFDIKVAKDMGFNGVRKHQKVEDPRFLYWADRMGFLVSGEMANAYVFDEQYAQRFTREWMEAVERDINHPSLIVWAPINESWGVPDLHTDPRQQAHLRGLYHATRTLDPARLVIGNEGWENVETTDLFAVHDYSPTYATLIARWKGVPEKPLPPNGRPYLVKGYQYNGSPLYLSEFGGIAYIPPGTQVPKESWGYSGVEKTPEAALERLRGQYKAIAESAFVGICYTQITDVEQEVNGLLTYDRKLKFPAGEIRKLNETLR
jgi:beta-galactosidase/beta-glucuronidase